MSIKNLLVSAATGAALLVATSALAGGPDVPMVAPMPEFQPYLYLEGNAGYADTNWNRIVRTPFNYFVVRNGNDGFTGGFDVGYMVSQHLGAEIGWYYLPGVRAYSTGLVAPFGALNADFYIHSWFAYLAPKLMVPIWNNLQVFGKVGIAARVAQFSGVGIINTDYANYWTPMFAVGFEYVCNHVIFDVQYIRIPGFSSDNTNRLRAVRIARRAPDVNSFTLSLGYQIPLGSM